MPRLHANGVASDPRASALQRLLAILQQRNLVRWRVTLLLWLNRFDGLGEFLPRPDDLPDHQVCLLLAQLPESISDTELVRCLSRADFLTWRVRHAVSHALWSFVDRPFAEFVRDADPVVYQLDIEHPAPDVTARWLLTQQSQSQ
ncbi:hypothetical protein [Cupriavidus basilensis]|uniref:hypothetical protein n=1 Tax=Cupriavidus basilensis TaxID=68895 RepID=UPI0005BD0724|nr:hypothetical protein [Cupriavidus basilensis]